MSTTQTLPMGRAAFGAAIKGRRDDQQDSFRLVYVEPDKSWLLVLADGMGGHAAGGLASRVAADAYVGSFRSSRAEGQPIPEALERALRRANSAIAKAQEADPEHTAGMGTTLVAAYVSGTEIRWISVGDSPLWVFREGRLVRLNEDHSLRSLTEGRSGLSGNLLQSAVMGEATIPLVDVHGDPEPLQAADLVVVGSDGVLTLEEKQIVGTLDQAGGADPELIVWLLLNAVQDRRKSNQDNCTLIVARPATIDAGERPPQKEATTGGRAGWFWAAAVLVIAAAAAVAFVLSR